MYRHSDPGRIGQIVGVITAIPCQALVRWPDSESTFEALGDLVDASAHLLEESTAASEITSR